VIPISYALVVHIAAGLNTTVQILPTVVHHMFLDQVSPRSLLMVVLATSSVCIKHVVFLLLLLVLLAIVLCGHMSAYVIVETTIAITVLLLQHVDLWVQKLKMVEHCQSLILVLDSQQLLLPDLLDTVLEVLTTSCKFKVKLLSA
jgi:hypothetical protein